MKSLYFVFLLVFSSTFLCGQTITGKIFSQAETPIANATILHTRTDHHTHSNREGEFELEHVALGDTLHVTHIGYAPQTVRITDLTAPLLIRLNQRSINLEEVSISPQIFALQIITDIDIKTNPVNSSQDILKKVPGLFIGQHAGGGKAEQIFLRGFDIDHGTDIAITVDGLPVNMVSHAHGQGYADMHFVIPETVEKIDFGKGPYQENKGNFATAGHVDFVTKTQLQESSIKLEAGQFNTQRLVGMFELLDAPEHMAYIASEMLTTDGYFDSPQHFHRINLFGKYAGLLNNQNRIAVTASYFDSQWDASGQIPNRAVASKSISRFGAIDDTEGGFTNRTNIVVDHSKVLSKHSSIKNKVFMSKYGFELYSNFTFFLEDSLNGDQIRQKEERVLYGMSSKYTRTFSSDKIHGNWVAGIQLRHDQSMDNELSHTKNRKETLQNLQLGDIVESNLGGYIGTTVHLKKWTINPSLRLDHFNYQYTDQLLSTFDPQKETKVILSPKFNLLFNARENLQLYLKTGKGFHSNDTRVIVQQRRRTILPAAYGADLGYIWKPNSKSVINLAAWTLYSEQEFVYVGDAGIVEPSGESRRRGMEFSYRHQPISWLVWNLDMNYTHARSLDAPEGENYIPLAPDLTVSGGLNLIGKSGFHGGVNTRHLATRPANEDNSIAAIGYTITDVNLGYSTNSMDFGIQIQNLFNTEWNETQFATESRLKEETEPIEEIHFTPGTPFFLKASIQYRF